MRLHVKIANIKLDYTFHSFDYLKDSIYAYENKEKGSSDYVMEVKIEEQIIPFVGEKQQVINGRSYFTSKRLDVFEVFSDDDMPLSEQIIFDKAKKKVTISINPIDVSDIAMKEYILSGMMFLEIAQREGYMSLHASAIDYKGDAILFAAPSKTGKSTHARMWREKFRGDVVMINDDKPLIFKEGETFFAAGTPFSGKQSLNHNIVRPLKAIIFLEQSAHDEIIQLSMTESLIRLVKNMLRPRDEETWNELLYIINELISEVPIYLLKATKSLSSVDLVHSTLYGGNHEN
jgi:hypothetical protein